MNIVKLNDFEKARSGLSRQESVSLLRECREVAFRRLHAGLIRMLGKVDDTLFEWSEKSEAKAEQNLYFDAMREMRLKRASIEIDFKAQLIEGFNREIRKEAGDAEGQSLSADQMSLVDEDGLEESLVVKNMVSKIEVECRHELHNLNQRVGVLLNDPELARAKNPIGCCRRSRSGESPTSRSEAGAELHSALFSSLPVFLPDTPIVRASTVRKPS